MNLNILVHDIVLMQPTLAEVEHVKLRLRFKSYTPPSDKFPAPAGLGKN